VSDLASSFVFRVDTPSSSFQYVRNSMFGVSCRRSSGSAVRPAVVSTSPGPPGDADRSQPRAPSPVAGATTDGDGPLSWPAYILIVPDINDDRVATPDGNPAERGRRSTEPGGFGDNGRPAGLVRRSGATPLDRRGVEGAVPSEPTGLAADGSNAPIICAAADGGV